MADVKTAKLFRNGGSQAVRLPAEFRFEGDEVFVHRDERTGDVILSISPRTGTIEAFLERAGYLDHDLEFELDRHGDFDDFDERDFFTDSEREVEQK